MKKLSHTIIDMINDVVKNTAGQQMTYEEYYDIASHIGHVNFLVFGTGHDSNLWRETNKDGITIFLENLDQWIPKDSKDILKVNYTTKITEYQEIINKPKRLTMDLPEHIVNCRWDVILVDSPMGWNNKTIGRMQSIYTASLLAQEHTLVYIHDCHRPVEDLYSRTFYRVDRQFKTLRRCFKS